MASLTPSLERAIARAASLPPSEQDALAAVLLNEIADEQRWDTLLSDPRSPLALERLAAAALEEDDAGQTEPLDSLLEDEASDTNPNDHQPR